LSKLQLNPAFNPSEFLTNSWQQKPLYIPQLIPGFTDIIEPGELAGLACEDYVESRLIREIKPGRWSVRHGPFAEAIFAALPGTHWTLLVQAVDQWVDEVAALRALFEFIPRWRIEDVMISYAEDSGGVGPHFDQYDVFLLQGSGQRKWQVGAKVPPDTTLDNQDGVGILPTFAAQQEFLLNPGDALYLPPQYAHWGQSIGASTCYSIGFRAPALSEMLEGLSDELIASCEAFERYTDINPSVPTHPACIDPAALSIAFQQVMTRLNNPSQFAHWFGCFVTRPKYPEAMENQLSTFTFTDIESGLDQGLHLAHHSGSRFAFISADAGNSLTLFVDGNAYELPSSDSDVILQLCDPTLLKEWNFKKIKQSSVLAGVLVQLLNDGSLLLR